MHRGISIRRLLLVVLLLLWTGSAWAASLAQQTTCAWSSGSSFTCTPPVSSTAGNPLVIVVGTGHESFSNTTVSSISDGTANSWAKLQSNSTSGTNSKNVEIWWTAGANSVTGNITINLSGTPPAASAVYSEFSGMTSVSADTSKGSSSGSGNTVLTGNQTTTTAQAVELIIGGFNVLNAAQTYASPAAESGSTAATWNLANSGSSQGTGTNGVTSALSYADVSGTGKYGCQATASGNNGYIGVAGSLKYTASTPTPTPTPGPTPICRYDPLLTGCSVD